MANIYKNQIDLTTNYSTTLYTVPSNSRAIVKSLLVSSDSGSATTITVDYLMEIQRQLKIYFV